MNKTIFLENRIVLVNESDQIKGDYIIHKIIHDKIDICPDKYGSTQEHWFKIIAASPKLGDLPEFEILPSTEDVENLVDKYLENEGKNIENPVRSAFKFIYILGYKQAKSETMFSLDDMKTCFEIGKNYQLTGENNFNEYIQSLTKPKEYEFIVEMEICEYCSGDGIYIDGDNNRLDCNIYGIHTETHPKIINNKIQGTWKLKN